MTMVAAVWSPIWPRSGLNGHGMERRRRRRSRARRSGSGRVELQQAGRAGRHSEQRCTARLGSARRELGEGGERLELATDIEESGEASRRDARRDGRRVATDVETQRRLRRRVEQRTEEEMEQGHFRNYNEVSKFQFINSIFLPILGLE